MFGIGWFSTGRDKAARDLLTTVQDKIRKGEIKALITFVFSNRESGESPDSDRFFDLVKSYHLPLVCSSSHKFQQTLQKPIETCRLAYDREVMKRIEPFHQELCVLAGYMLIVGPEMCQKYNLINLHPAAPGGPTGSWQEVVWKLIESRAPSSGVMMHLVTPELDRGPVITYCTFPIAGKPFDDAWREIGQRSLPQIREQEGENNTLFRLIRQEGLAREFPLITATLKAFASGEVRIKSQQLIDSGGRTLEGYDLTTEIEKTICRST